MSDPRQPDEQSVVTMLRDLLGSDAKATDQEIHAHLASWIEENPDKVGQLVDALGGDPKHVDTVTADQLLSALVDMSEHDLKALPDDMRRLLERKKKQRASSQTGQAVNHEYDDAPAASAEDNPDIIPLFGDQEADPSPDPEPDPTPPKPSPFNR